MKIIFWTSLLGVIYAYFLYPALLAVLARLATRSPTPVTEQAPESVSMIIPVHNEERILPTKLENLAALDYPHDHLQVIFVSDGSTDGTLKLLRDAAANLPFQLVVLEVPERAGKAHALNTGLEAADGQIIIFTDASILLEPGAVSALLQPFADPGVGCVSGEDHIAGGAGEGLYGRYELYLRNQESAVASIVGASGSFYAQRRALVQPFQPGLAPDFLSVLNTVEQGYRAQTEPAARGHMTAVARPEQEFQRKVRTLLRGIATLFAKPALMNPLRYGRFAWLLLSHKLIRWLVPFMLIAALLSNIALTDTGLYGVLLVLQIGFYGLAALAYRGVAGLHDNPLGRIALFFVMANVAILIAWFRYLKGERQELWTPSERRVMKETP
ncbi:MAG: glycosyltransferase family 2 protein [Gammaproteobacteria bacterium]|nr:glycosyltransferase family 2 protein [Gammaproteobacteria bacterium]